jgi:D-ribose pyranose/furanose isomerase RbsD
MINYISDQPMSQKDFEKLLLFKNIAKEEPVNNKTVYEREKAIESAKNYIYTPEEVAKVSNQRFSKALKTGDLSGFPNVLYFKSQKEIELKRKLEFLP